MRRQDRTENYRFTARPNSSNYYLRKKAEEIKSKERWRFIKRKMASMMLLVIILGSGLVAVLGLFEIASFFVR